MSKIRIKIEHFFEQLASFVYGYKYIVMILMLAAIGLLASQLPDIKIDTSTEGFLHDNDPILINYEAFRDQFGREEIALVALKSPDIFNESFLKTLKDLHDDLKDNLPYLDDITSLIDARNTHGKKDELIVEDLFETFPDTAAAMAEKEKRARNNQIYKNLLLSEDGNYTTIVIKTITYSREEQTKEDELKDFIGEDGDAFLLDEDLEHGAALSKGSLGHQKAQTRKKYLTDQENSEFVKVLETIVDRHRTPEIEMYIAGTPVITDFLKRSMVNDMRKFMGIAVVTIAILLFIMFRRISGIVLPIFIVIVSLLSTIGLMAFANVPIKTPTQILPIFLLSVAVGASVHVLVIFFQHFDKNRIKKDAIIYALGHSGLPIFMTSLTTAGGLLSFSTAAVAPIADLGLFASTGVILSFIYTIIFLPALLAIIPIKPKAKAKISNNSGEIKTDGVMENILNFSIHTSTTYPVRVLIVFFIAMLIAISSIHKIQISHDPVRWLPDTPGGIRLINEKIDKVFKGTTSLEVIIDTGKINGLYEPSFLNKLEKASEFFEKYKDDICYVGKAFSITSVVKETNQALHENNPEFYNIPQERELVAQELFLFENSGTDDLEDFTDSQFSKARFTIKMPFVDAIAYSGFIEMTDQYFTKEFASSKIQLTGMISMLARVLTNALFSMIKSYAYAFIVITILMILLIGRFKIGLLSMIPNLYPIVIMLGIMGWFNLPMDLFAMMVASIAIGLAVDDTIHFMHNFRKYFEEYGDAKKAVHETLHTTGRAMLVTTCVLSTGFFTFMFAQMNNLFNFGFLIGITLITALLADYFIAPALMVLVNKNKKITFNK
ncbi:MAG: MMPL family transporter [Desulfobacula sp.]|nr:MMPL family transporter [Desulfobacula sp.]